MTSLPTIAIENPKKRGTPLVINQADFDAKKHRVFEAAAESKEIAPTGENKPDGNQGGGEQKPAPAEPADDTPPLPAAEPQAPVGEVPLPANSPAPAATSVPEIVLKDKTEPGAAAGPAAPAAVTEPLVVVGDQAEPRTQDQPAASTPAEPGGAKPAETVDAKAAGKKNRK